MHPDQGVSIFSGTWATQIFEIPAILVSWMVEQAALPLQVKYFQLIKLREENI